MGVRPKAPFACSLSVQGKLVGGGGGGGSCEGLLVTGKRRGGLSYFLGQVFDSPFSNEP